MKTKSKILIAVLFFMCLSLPQFLKAQSPPIACNYFVSNSLTGCNIVVDVQFYNSGGPCKLYPGVTISPGGGITFNCAPCGTVTDVKTTVISVNSVAQTGVSVQKVNLGGGVNFPGTTTCSVNGGMILHWTFLQTDITPN